MTALLMATWAGPFEAVGSATAVGVDIIWSGTLLGVDAGWFRTRGGPLSSATERATSTHNEREPAPSEVTQAHSA